MCSAPRRETCCACGSYMWKVDSRTLSSRLFIQHVAFSSRSSSGRPRSAAVSYPNLLQTWPLIVCVALLFLLMEFIIITKKAPVTHCWVDCIVSSHVSLIWLITALETKLEKTTIAFTVMHLQWKYMGQNI